MHRRLHNAISAFLATAAVLAIGLLVAAQPAPFVPDHGAMPLVADAATPAAPSDPSVLAAEVAAAAAMAAAARRGKAAPSPSTDPEPRRAARKGKRHHRQAFVMPYFSFAPRG